MTTDYNAVATAVQKLRAGNDEQQALLQSVLPLLSNMAALRAEEATLRNNIATLQAAEKDAISKRHLAEADAAAFVGEYRTRRPALEKELADLEEKIVQARKAVPA